MTSQQLKRANEIEEEINLLLIIRKELQNQDSDMKFSGLCSVIFRLEYIFFSD